MQSYNARLSIFVLLIIVLTAILLASPPALAADNKPITPGDKGHLAFFFTANLGVKGAQSAYGSFILSYEQVRKSLDAMGYTYTYHSKLPIKISNSGLILSLDKANLSQSAGIVLIKKGGKFRVVYGVYSEASIMKLIKQYYTKR